ncbi:TonB-dependent receptor domain-containing protein [Robiginitalea sp. SC105]|uniref:TonB-dependent receptor n=1 Tax=Robiginitalea sp. SC105 TaxID=2762332 RepID=UPI00163A7E4B|nr:TonB-dependent receptor [Robiginitalea sp. SC105]MBC2840645.1 TonB-dependent receptor [Robiginitalea sp. SC105]
MRNIFLVFLILALGLPTGVSSQDCRLALQGSVIDFHDKSPLVGATLVLLNTDKATVSDIDGTYRFTGLCPGDYEIEISHPECRTTLYPLTLSSDTNFDFKLEHHVELLEEVDVIGDAIMDKTNSAQEVTLEKNVLERFSSASLGDALKELNGVSSLNTGANIVKPVIHGLNGSRVLILNDGVRMQDMEWGDEHAPNVDINAAGSVSVIKGASALQFGGDAIGGVVVMEPERVRATDSLYGQTLLSGVTNGRGGTLASSLTRSFESGWFVRGQGSLKILGDQEAPDYVLSNTGMRERAGYFQFGNQQLEWGFNARYSIYQSDIAILRASHIGNVDDLIRSINSGQPLIIRPFTYDLDSPRQEVTHHLGKVEFYRRFEGVGKWQLQYDFQDNRRFEYDVRVGDDRGTPSIDLNLTTHTFSTDFKWDASTRYELHTGLVMRYQDNFANPATGVRRLIPDYEKYDLGGFLIGELRLNSKWILDSGVRYDFSRIDAQKFYQNSRWEERGYDEDFQQFVKEDLGTQLLTNPVFDYHNISLSVGTKYDWDLRHSLRINYALSQRAPNPSELFSDGLHHSAARIELGDLRIGSESSHKFAASFEYRKDDWGLLLEPYANFINDFILLEPTGVEFTIRGAFPVWEYRSTNAYLLGMDGSGYVNWSDSFRSDLGFAMVKGKDTSRDQALINIPPANFWHRLNFFRDDWNGFEFSVRGDWVLRQNEFPPNIFVFSPEQQQEVLLEINTPPRGYLIFGFRTQMEFDLGNASLLTTSLSASNIFNSRYRDYLNRQRFFADNVGRNIMLQVKLNY